METLLVPLRQSIDLTNVRVLAEIRFMYLMVLTSADSTCRMMSD